MFVAAEQCIFDASVATPVRNSRLFDFNDLRRVAWDRCFRCPWKCQISNMQATYMEHCFGECSGVTSVWQATVEFEKRSLGFDSRPQCFCNCRRLDGVARSQVRDRSCTA